MISRKQYDGSKAARAAVWRGNSRFSDATKGLRRAASAPHIASGGRQETIQAMDIESLLPMIGGGGITLLLLAAFIILYFPAFFAALDRIAYQGWVGAAYFTSRLTEETLDWLATDRQ